MNILLSFSSYTLSAVQWIESAITDIVGIIIYLNKQPEQSSSYPCG